jgi:hypothetical protein
MRRLLFLLAATCFWLDHGFAQETPKHKSDAETRRDFAVLETVLQDLLALPPDSLLRTTEVLFSPDAPRHRPTHDDVFARGRTNKWDQLPPAQLSLARQAADDLIRRSEEKDAFKAFKPKDKRIIVWDKRRAEAERDSHGRYSRPQVFRAFPPGYSKDAQLAMLHLNFPWSVHAGTATYVLARKQGEWVIVTRVFVYFV